MKKILIVDDQPMMRSLLRRVCAESDDEVIESADGYDAVEAYQRHRPDWVLMDLRMPGLDGLSATSRIKTVDPEARVIVVTQDSDPLFRDAALKAGAAGFFTKDDLMLVRNYLQTQSI